VASPHDALFFREAFGRQMQRYDRGMDQAFIVSPINSKYSDDANLRLTDQVRRHIVGSLDYGETFYVSAEITRLLLDASSKLERRHLFHFEPNDFPALVGTVYFDGDVLLPTILTKTGYQSLRAIVWGQLAHPVKGSNLDKEPSEIYTSELAEGAEISGKAIYTVVDTHPAGRDQYGPWRMRHWIPLDYDVRYAPEMINVNPERDTWRMYMTDEEKEKDDRDAEESVYRVFTLMYVLLHFLQTEILARHPQDTDAAHVRVMKKEGRPPAQFRVITLRRYASTRGTGEGEVAWTHRWLQRGHWRNQRVGPGRATTRPVWIRAAIKGPADKPLIVRDTVQAVIR
jgi:hypothetical protein